MARGFGSWGLLFGFVASALGAQPRLLYYEGPLKPELVLKEKEGELRQVKVYHNVWVSCKGQVVLNKTSEEGNFTLAKYPYDGCGQGEGHCSQPMYIRPEITPLELSPGGPVDVIVLLTQPQWGAYYHFLVDSLSRLAWVKEQYPSVVEDPTTHFHVGFVNSVARDWAKLAGIKAAEDITVERLLDGWWKAATVYYPPSNQCANEKVGAEPRAISWLTETVTANLQVRAPALSCAQYRAGQQALAVLVQRDFRKGHARAVQNFEEVLAAVQKELGGWKVLVFSDYPATPGVFETCKIFSCADLILGPHGAGFANLVCARAGTPLLEFQKLIHSWDFEMLALKKSMPYFGLTVFEDHYGPGNVSVAELKAQLQLAVLKASPGEVSFAKKVREQLGDALAGLSETSLNCPDLWLVAPSHFLLGLVVGVGVAWALFRGSSARNQRGGK